VPPAAAGATPNIREGGAIRSSKHQLVLELKMLERRTLATIRKALASKALAEPVAARVLSKVRKTPPTQFCASSGGSDVQNSSLLLLDI
jgi:hypothetical protein